MSEERRPGGAGDHAWTVDSLMEILDVLWGELPDENVRALDEIHPEIVQACQIIHELTSRR